MLDKKSNKTSLKFSSKASLACSLLATVPFIISACGGGSSSSGNNASQSIGTINGHNVVLSASSFSLNESSDIQVGSITVQGLQTGESDITLTFSYPFAPATTFTDVPTPTITTTPTICVVNKLSPSCAINVSGNGSAESTYDYAVNYAIMHGESGTLTNPMPVVINNNLPLQRAGSLTMVLGSAQLNYESSTTATITLSNSAGITSLPVSIVKDNNKVSVTPNSCDLSTTNTSCTINLTAGAESGITYITTSARGYADILESVTVNAPITNKWVFVSQSSPNGAMLVNGTGASWQTATSNGIESADQICQHDAESAGWIGPNANVAKALTWKAMIVDGTNRSALPTPIDWVYTADTAYQDIKSGQTIGTTNTDATFDFPVTSAWGQGSGYDWEPFATTLYTWTGLSGDWTSVQGAQAGFKSLNCVNWTSNEEPNWLKPAEFLVLGSTGTPVAEGLYYYDNRMMSGNIRTCPETDTVGEQAIRLVCVSQ